MGKSTHGTTKDSFIQSKSYLNGGSVTSHPYPKYIYKNEKNLFNPLKQTANIHEVRAFHMSDPDERLSRVLFSQHSVKRRPSMSIRTKLQSVDLVSPRSVQA